MYTEFACSGGVLRPSCPDSRHITITKAHWGKYNLACSDCCPPNPAFDCTVDVETVNNEYFELLKNQCDGLESCQIDYDYRYLIYQCEVGMYADYIQLFYDCTPVDTTGPVGFTVQLNSGDANIHFLTYTQNQVLPFNSVLSNFGGHYSVGTSTFVCPYAGVYLFSTSVNQEDNNNVKGSIFRNNKRLTRSEGGVGTNHDSATAVVVVECESGDLVFVNVEEGGKFDAFWSPVHFTGYLLHRF